MIISSSNLPSKGKLSPIELVDLKPLTYKQIVKYNSRKNTNEISKTIWDIECILSDIPCYESLSAYDLKSLIFTRKYISATFNDKVKVTINGSLYHFDVSDLSFKEISDELLNISAINISGTVLPFNVPTIGRLYKTLKLLEGNDGLDLRFIMIATSLGADTNYSQVMDALSNATQGDIVTIDYLDKLINDPLNDVVIKGGEAVVNVSDTITDIFRFIRINNELDRDKIINK